MRRCFPLNKSLCAAILDDPFADDESSDGESLTDETWSEDDEPTTSDEDFVVEDPVSSQ